MHMGLYPKVSISFFRNIEDDLLKRREKLLNEPVWHGNWSGGWNQPQQQYEFVIGPEDRESSGDTDFFHMSHHIFHELDEMMKQMFSGFGRFGTEDSFPNAGNFDGLCIFIRSLFWAIPPCIVSQIQNHICQAFLITKGKRYSFLLCTDIDDSSI